MPAARTPCSATSTARSVTRLAREIWELAAELLEREPNPYIGDVYERLGTLLEEEGRTEEALQMLQRAYGARQHTKAN